MNIVLKVVIGIVAVVAAAFVALIVAVTFLIEPDDYRPFIVDAVEDATGRVFTLEGELGLKLLPCCSVSLGPASLASPAGFPEPQFASLEAAALSVKIWPLIARRQVEIGTVTLSGLDLNLVSTADGAVNWEIEADETAPDAPPEAQSTPIGLSVEGLVVRDARMHYRDLASGQSYTVSGLSLNTGLAMAGDRLTVAAPALAATLAGTGLPGEVSADLNAGTVVVNLADDTEVAVDRFDIALAMLDARLRVSGGGRAGTELDLEGDFALQETRARDLLAAVAAEAYQPVGEDALRRLSAQGRWSLGSASAAVTNLIVQIDDSRLTGTATVQDFDTLASSFDVTLDAIELDPYLPAGDAAAPQAGDAGEGPTELPLATLAEVPVDGRIRIGRLGAAGVALEDVDFSLTSNAAGDVSTRLSARGLDGSVTAEGGGQVSGSTPALTGTLTVEAVSPRALLAALDAATETTNPDVLQRFGGRTEWRLTPRQASASNMRWQLDGSTLTGSAGVDDFDALAAHFDLTLDRLNVDDYLPPVAETDAEEADAELIPLDAIRGLALDGRLRAGELVVSKLRLGDVEAQVRAADGVLRLEPLTANLYGGRYDGKVIIDATGAEPTVTLDQQLAAVQIQQVLGQFFATDLLSGALSLQLNGSGTGNTTTALLRGLAADVSMEMSDGVYRGTDLTYQLKRARALLKNEPAPAEPETTVTPIRALQATGRMVDGVLQTRELTARTDSLRLVGEGGINLLELALDYDFTARVLEGAGGELGDLANLAIPLTLEGPLSGPRVGVDLEGLLTGAIRETVQQKARQALLDRLGGDEQGGGGGDAAAGAGSEAGGTTAAPQEEAKPKAEDVIKRGLRELLRSRQQDESQAESPPDDDQQSP